MIALLAAGVLLQLIVVAVMIGACKAARADMNHRKDLLFVQVLGCLVHTAALLSIAGAGWLAWELVVRLLVWVSLASVGLGS